jgi:hypothetical protein
MWFLVFFIINTAFESVKWTAYILVSNCINNIVFIQIDTSGNCVGCLFTETCLILLKISVTDTSILI